MEPSESCLLAMTECMRLMLVLVPLVTVKELSRALGSGVLGRMLRDPSPPKFEWPAAAVALGSPASCARTVRVRATPS